MAVWINCWGSYFLKQRFACHVDWGDTSALRLKMCYNAPTRHITGEILFQLVFHIPTASTPFFANFPFPYNNSRLFFFLFPFEFWNTDTLGLHVGGQLIREPVNHLIKSCPTVQRDHVSNVGSQLTFVYFFVDFKIIDSGHVSVHTYVLASCGISPSSVSISTPERQRMEITQYFLNTLYSGHFINLKSFNESLWFTPLICLGVSFTHKKTYIKNYHTFF